MVLNKSGWSLSGAVISAVLQFQLICTYSWPLWHILHSSLLPVQLSVMCYFSEVFYYYYYFTVTLLRTLSSPLSCPNSGFSTVTTCCPAATWGSSSCGHPQNLVYNVQALLERSCLKCWWCFFSVKAPELGLWLLWFYKVFYRPYFSHLSASLVQTDVLTWDVHLLSPAPVRPYSQQALFISL